MWFLKYKYNVLRLYFQRKIGHRWITFCILCEQLWFPIALDTVPLWEVVKLKVLRDVEQDTIWFISWLESFPSAKYKPGAHQFPFLENMVGSCLGFFICLSGWSGDYLLTTKTWSHVLYTTCKHKTLYTKFPGLSHSPLWSTNSWRLRKH